MIINNFNYGKKKTPNFETCESKLLLLVSDFINKNYSDHHHIDNCIDMISLEANICFIKNKR